MEPENQMHRMVRSTAKPFAVARLPVEIDDYVASDWRAYADLDLEAAIASAAVTFDAAASAQRWVEGRREAFEQTAAGMVPRWWTIRMARLEGTIAGSITWDSSVHADGQRELVVISMAVGSRFRRQGIGTLLLQDALQVAQSAHITRMALDVASINGVAAAFYEKLGFVKE
jgi:ribosomal protein S18 acetylase RimI-like enzyme